VAHVLSRRFFARPTLDVARDLIGCVLVHETPEGRLAGRIVETEAYVGCEDLACHARFGRTARSEVLWSVPGTAYVYLIYGMYDLLNVVTEREGTPAAVLIRALEPLSPLGATSCSGPGRLTRTLGIDRTHNRRDLTTGALRIERRRERRKPEVATSPRIGVDYAGEWARLPWRFTDPASPALSRRP
jgi:DNA-3-methyladenine glycosylase